MNPLDAILIIVILAICLLLACVVVRQQHTLSNLREDLKSRTAMDWYVDVACRQFSLHVEDPYVYQTGGTLKDTTKRCYHCGCPEALGHAGNCIWVAVAPLRKKFYQS